MPSPGEDIQAWSKTALDNGDADPLINWVEGQARASVNNSSRSEMAAHAKDRDLRNGSIVTTGSANAQAFLSGLTYTSVPTNLVVRLKIGSGLTNTGSATLNMDGIGAVAIVTSDGDHLRGNELTAGDYADLVFNGTNWVFLYARQFWQDQIEGGGGIIIGKQIFATPGTFSFVPSPGAECFIVECIGGGGGGGGTVNTVASNGLGGGGGGAGGFSRVYLTAAQVGGSQAVVVGAGGPGGVLGGGNGQNGAETNFGGGLCVARAGAGGPGNGGLNVDGGAGAIAGLGDVAGTGQAGEPGLAHTQVLSGQSGRGGSTAFGSGGASIITATGAHGNNATGYGAGGGGGASYGGFSPTQGGNGAGGLVIVTEFAGRGAPGRDGEDGPQGPIGPVGPSGPGTGDVLRSGTPTANQIAVWTDASHIKGQDPASLTGFTTGDAKLTLKAVADAGWVMMADGSIGSATSGADNRANADCQALFTLLYAYPDAWLPLQTSTGAATTRAAQGAAATAWANNCRMKLPRQLGRALAVGGAGSGLTARVTGAYMGEETHIQTVSEMASHTHTVPDAGHQHDVAPISAPVMLATSPPTIAVDPGVTVGVANYGGQIPINEASAMRTTLTTSGITATNSNGGAQPMTLMQPTAFWNVMLKL